MRNLLFVSIFVLIFCAPVFSQINQTSPCPKIIVVAPTEITKPGQEMTFAVKVEGFSGQNLAYSWTVDKGTIVEGREASLMKVFTDGSINEQNITASVEIKGLPEGCTNTASEKGFVSMGVADPIQLDSYERISFAEEKARISRGLSTLKEHKDLMYLFIIYYTKKTVLIYWQKE